MACRAPTSSTTCTGTPIGAVLGYDNERRWVVNSSVASLSRAASPRMTQSEPMAVAAIILDV
jgi:hypothetical protein